MSDTNIKTTNQKQKLKTTEEIEKENSDLMAAFESETKLDSDKLAHLKEKLKKREEKMEVISKQEFSITFGVIGVGQGGSRIAEEFYRLGYDVGVINTAAQDLKFIEVPEHLKLHLDASLGGTGKNLELSRQIFTDHRDVVKEFVHRVSDGCDMLWLAVSAGGGTGSGSAEVLVPLFYELGKPVGVIFILPKASEDAQSKKNAIETLAKLARMSADDTISALVVVDNARIEQIYGGLSQAEFWKKANSAIVEPINLFNTLTAQPSQYSSLDASDFGRIISTGDCSTYGMIEVSNYMEETALAEAVIESLNSNMLASGFDLSQTKTGGVIIVGSDAVLRQLPTLHIDYAMNMISEQTHGANIYQGVYALEGFGDTVKIFCWVAGLGLPQERVKNLKQESKALEELATQKNISRESNMTLDLEENKIATAQEQIHQKIKNKNSGFNKLQSGARKSIIDRRKR